jgi:hypothetical protein
VSSTTLSLREALRLCGDSRLPENPIEEAEACAKARRDTARQRPDLGSEAIDREAAASLGVPLTDFRHLLQLRQLGAEVRDLVADGAISVGQALALSPIPESRRQRALAREAAAQDLPPDVVGVAARLLVADISLRVHVAIRRARKSCQPSAISRQPSAISQAS